MKRLLAFLAVIAVTTAAAPVLAQQAIKVATTTSFENSGLAEILLPAIKSELGLDVQLLVVGTGQAIELGEKGDVDAVLVHSRKAEEDFVKSGFGTERTPFMYNDYIVVGPAADPAKVGAAGSATDAMNAIRAARAPFASRGDDSGTHRREVDLWKKAGADPEAFDAAWYRETGSGMGATLNNAAGTGAYTLADRGSWLAFENKGDLKVLYEGDIALRNQYAFIPVSREKHPHVNHEAAVKVRDWLTGEKGQGMIGAYRIGGEAAFVPNAGQAGS